MDHTPDISRVRRVLVILNLLTVFGILFCTLWPFDPFPLNRVSWLPGTAGLSFQSRGVILSRAIDNPTRFPSNNACSLEVWVRPAQTDSVSTILNIYLPGNPYKFLLRQYLVGLIISQDVPSRWRKPVRLKLDVDETLRREQLSFITITSGPSGTSVYLDANIRRFVPNDDIPCGDLSGQLVMGSSTVQPDAWSGEILGVAFYPEELTAREVSESYQWWTNGAYKGIAPPKTAISRYTFSEGKGNIVHDQGMSKRDLYIPTRYLVPHHSFLTPPWLEFDASWDYCADLTRNIIGFMPLGLLLCGLFSLSPKIRHPILLSILLGAGLSLGVEILQAAVPQRASGMTDVVTNSLGTALGALLARTRSVGTVLVRYTEKFARLRRFE